VPQLALQHALSHRPHISSTSTLTDASIGGEKATAQSKISQRQQQQQRLWFLDSGELLHLLQDQRNSIIIIISGISNFKMHHLIARA